MGMQTVIPTKKRVDGKQMKVYYEALALSRHYGLRSNPRRESLVHHSAGHDPTPLDRPEDHRCIGRGKNDVVLHLNSVAEPAYVGPNLDRFLAGTMVCAKVATHGVSSL
jgi:hypothetical protein